MQRKDKEHISGFQSQMETKKKKLVNTTTATLLYQVWIRGRSSRL